MINYISDQDHSIVYRGFGKDVGKVDSCDIQQGYLTINNGEINMQALDDFLIEYRNLPQNQKNKFYLDLVIVDNFTHKSQIIAQDVDLVPKAMIIDFFQEFMNKLNGIQTNRVPVPLNRNGDFLVKNFKVKII